MTAVTSAQGGVRNWRELVILLDGDVRENLKALPDESVHCCVTSPPYWGLRVYKTEAQVWGGDAKCVHGWGEWVESAISYVPSSKSTLDGGKGPRQEPLSSHSGLCSYCGAWRGHLGLEPTPEMYVEHLVGVFREVRRVLRREATLWLVIGDCYSSSGPGCKGVSGKSGLHGAQGNTTYRRTLEQSVGSRQSTLTPSCKPKDLIGVPWLLAFALRADGWYLRCPIIWHKPNCMPGSQKDRPTIDYEYVLLLSKSERYYYDGEAVKEPALRAGRAPGGNKHVDKSRNDADRDMSKPVATQRVRRAVWSIATQSTPVPGVHFASYPTALVDLCVRAGCPQGGTVLDPFVGTGTTCVVATRLGRASIGIDLSPEYLAAAEKRLEMDK